MYIHRNDQLSAIPRKQLSINSCVNVMLFHPSLPSIIAVGCYSGMFWSVKVEISRRKYCVAGEIILCNIAHDSDDEDNIIYKVNGHNEPITSMSWIIGTDTAKTVLLATSSLDGYINLWNFCITSSSLLSIKHK